MTTKQVNKQSYASHIGSVTIPEGIPRAHGDGVCTITYSTNRQLQVIHLTVQLIRIKHFPVYILSSVQHFFDIGKLANQCVVLCYFKAGCFGANALGKPLKCCRNRSEHDPHMCSGYQYWYSGGSWMGQHC